MPTLFLPISPATPCSHLVLAWLKNALPPFRLFLLQCSTVLLRRISPWFLFSCREELLISELLVLYHFNRSFATHRTSPSLFLSLPRISPASLCLGNVQVTGTSQSYSLRSGVFQFFCLLTTLNSVWAHSLEPRSTPLTHVPHVCQAICMVTILASHDRILETT